MLLNAIPRSRGTATRRYRRLHNAASVGAGDFPSSKQARIRIVHFFTKKPQ